MDRETSTTTYWVWAIVLVALVVLGVWWLTANDTNPLVPNTGETAGESAVDDVLNYNAQ